MFDIGQNDIAGAFYSKSFDQIVASIPLVLAEFEAGIKVSFSFFWPNWYHPLTSINNFGFKTSSD